MDTRGLLLIVVVTAASLSDQAGARKIFKQMRGTCKKLRKVWVDGTYRGAEWTAWVKAKYHIVLESVARAEGQKGFAVLPHRWVVERTLAWLNQCRRWSKDYEELPTTSETFGPRSPRRPLGLDDSPRRSESRHHAGLQPESYLAILSHHAYQGEGWTKEVAVGTVIQETSQGNDDRHQRWERLERADLFAQYRDLHAEGLSQRQAAQVLEVPRSTLQAWRA